MQDDWRRGVPTPTTTSRAMNVNIAQADVVALCRKHDASISAIETLHSGGTHVVLRNGEGADRMRKAFGKKVITGAVVRTPWVRNG